MNSNLPLGAENNPKAPFNRREKKILVYTIKTYEVIVDADDWDNMEMGEQWWYLRKEYKYHNDIAEELDDFEEE